MNHDDIFTTISNMVREKQVLQSIENDDDFFDAGASSLTIVDLQIQVEQTLNLKVPTEKLMAEPTIAAWAAAYIEQASPVAS